MNTPRTIQTKRTRPKAGFRKLHAATRFSRKRKQRAATTASPEDLGEVPGVGVPLALVVILLLHIAAIAGIWIHDRWSSNADLTSVKPSLKEEAKPKRIAELKPYTVNPGDTAESIAQAQGFDVDALLRVNGDISEYQAGWIINLPPARLEESSSGETSEGQPAPTIAAFAPTERPAIQTSNEEILPGATPGDLVEVGSPEAEAGRTEEAVLIRPLRPLGADSSSSGGTTSGAGGIHVVKSGETLWRIARNHGITVDQLSRANPRVNPNTLKIGAKLVIPTGP